QTKRNREAVAELTSLIDYLKNNPSELDETGRGVLAAAHANRGIVHDRMGVYKKALDDYVESLRTDEDSVAGPGVIHKILYGNERVSNVRNRAKYIYEQLQKPESERLMRVPEIDALQRMHRP
ncbi:MAG: tetratricopeptide repeat protein, partial [Methyloligellaceae bacterium]